MRKKYVWPHKPEVQLPALAKDENAATAIRVRIELPRAQLTVDDNAMAT